MMEEKKGPQSRAERYHSEMLLRQFPFLKDHLKNEEYPLAFSYRKPENLFGLSLVFIGLFTGSDALLHLSSFGSVFFGMLVLLAGAALLYGGFWAIFFAKRSYVLVTSKRVVYQKTDLAGRPGEVVSLPRSEIKRVRFLKSTVMYRAGRGDGGVSLETKSGKTLLLPSMLQGENIFGALR